MSKKVRINKVQFKKWLRALRSGKYKQTVGTLQDNNGYCCLGVACKVLIPKAKLSFKMEDNEDGELTETEFMAGDLPNEQKYAPKWLKDIVEVSVPNEEYDEEWDDEDKKTTIEEITSLNDSYYWNFERIADALEATYMPKKVKKAKKKKAIA